MPKSGDPLAHLAPDPREFATLPDEQRILAMRRDRCIDYARATAILKRLSWLLDTPRRARMPCLLIHGESNIGKTQLMRKFIRDHPPGFDERREVERLQIVSMQMPALPNQTRFYAALLSEIGVSHSPRSSVAVLERHGAPAAALDEAARMLVVDEVHHLLAGSHREQRASMNLLKCLANDL